MGDDANNLGDLTVGVTGDFSELQSSLDQAASAAEAGAATIGDALGTVETAAESVTTALQTVLASASDLNSGDFAIFKSVLEGDAQAGIALEQSLSDLAASATTVGEAVSGQAAAALEQLQSAAEGAQTPIAELPGELDHVAESAHEDESALAGMAEGLLAIGEALAVTEALKEFVTEAIEVYGATQNVITSLELLGQSSAEAEETISQLSDMSLQLGVPFGDLEQSARRLTVALQGVEGIDVTDVLTAAANAAALTGKSFDTVTTALQRVEVTGQVTSRQLMQLGLTWQQLADQADSSVAEVQALLKKGGQDATADLQLVIDTINAMASGAAQAQAQTILGQITVLKNEVELLFDSIGQTIAPVVANIIAGIGAVVNVARDALTAFQELPAPIQNVAVVVGLVTAAIVPVTLAVGAFGLALSGIATIGPAFTALMASIATLAGEDAVAEGAAAVATEAHGAAAATTAVELEGLAAAEGTAATTAEGATAAIGIGGLGGALLAIAAYALPAAMAIAVTVDNVNQLKQRWADMDTEIRSHSIMDAIQAGATLQQLEQIGNSVAQIKTAFGDMGTGATTVMQAISNSAQTPIQTLTDLGYSGDQVSTALKGIGTAAVSAWQAMQSGATIDEMKQVGINVDAVTAALNKMGAAAKQSFSDLSLGITVVSDGLVIFSANSNNVSSSILKLQENVATAKQSVQDYTLAMQAGIDVDKNGISIADDLAAAKVNLAKTEKTLADAIGQTTTAVQGQQTYWDAFIKKQTQADDALKGTEQVLYQLYVALGQGITEINGLSVAEQLIPAASKAATDAENSHTKALGGLKDAAHGASQEMQTVLTQGQAGVIIMTQGATSTLAAAGSMGNLRDATKLATDAQAGFVGPLQQSIQVLGNQGSIIRDQIVTGYTDASKVGQEFIGIVDDGTQALYGESEAGQEIAKSTLAVSGSYADATAKAVAFTGASQAVLDQLAKQNKAWADGMIAVQNYAGQMVIETNAATDNAKGAADVGAAVNSARQMMTDAISGTNDYANQLLGVAADADKAAAAVNNLTSAVTKLGKAGKGGASAGEDSLGIGGIGGIAPGSTGSLASLLEGSIGLAQGDVGGTVAPGVDQGVIDQWAQELADATGEVVTTLDGRFVPAAQTAAANAAAMAQATASQTAATTANTTATQAATSVTTAATTALTAAQTSFIDAAAAGDTIVTSFGALPPTIQDFLNSVDGTLVAYDDTTGALQYSTAAIDGHVHALMAAVAANELSTTTTQLATSATAALANSTTSAATAAASLGPVILQTATAAATVTTATQAVASAFQMLATNILTPAPTSPFGNQSLSSILATPSSLELPTFFGQQAQSGTTTAGNGVNLTVNVTGNSITSQALVNQLVDQVGNALINKLRVTGGLKL